MASAKKAKGKQLETEVRRLADRWGVGAPRLWRIEPPMQAGRIVAAAPCDFLGCLPDGRAVAVECKEVTADARFGFARLESHQVATLEAIATRGGVGILVVRVGVVTWALRWEALRGPWTHWATGGAVVGEASLDVAALDRLGRRLVGVDWWTALPGLPVEGDVAQGRLFGGAT
jgi:hypothetical protein